MSKKIDVETLKHWFKERNITHWKIADCASRDALELADKRIAELERKLNPRRWTKAESDAWHRAIPNIQAAFEALAQIGGDDARS